MNDFPVYSTCSFHLTSSSLFQRADIFYHCLFQPSFSLSSPFILAFIQPFKSVYFSLRSLFFSLVRTFILALNKPSFNLASPKSNLAFIQPCKSAFEDSYIGCFKHNFSLHIAFKQPSYRLRRQAHRHAPRLPLARFLSTFEVRCIGKIPPIWGDNSLRTASKWCKNQTEGDLKAT